MKQQLRWGLWLAVVVALACASGDRAAMQQSSPKSTPAPAAKEDCATWPEVVNAAYLQVLETPAHGEWAKTASEKLARSEMSVRELITGLALSDEYKDRFVSSRPAEEVVRVLYRHVLAREAQAAELKSAADTNLAKDFVPFVKALVAGAEYGQRFGTMLVPGAAAGSRQCRFPLKLNRRDEFAGGHLITTEVTLEASGQFRAATRFKSAAGQQPFCGKVGLWLLDDADRVVGVIGPPREALWCAGGSGRDQHQEHIERWQGSIPRQILDMVTAAALLQREAGIEPQSMTRENAERAAQIKQMVR